jgi:hypothetical protein
MQTNPDFKEFFESFNTHSVRYLVVGGYAVIYHTGPRATVDIDVLIDATPENAKRVMAALAGFGFGGIGLKEADFATPGQTVQLGYPPNRIDINTSITGVGFEEAYADRCASSYGGVPVAYIGAEELLRNKEAVCRDKDLLDAKLLREKLRR